MKCFFLLMSFVNLLKILASQGCWSDLAWIIQEKQLECNPQTSHIFFPCISRSHFIWVLHVSIPLLRIYFLFGKSIKSSYKKKKMLCKEAATKLQKFQFISAIYTYTYEMQCIYRSIGREVVSQIILCGSICYPTNKNLHSIVVSLKI